MIRRSVLRLSWCKRSEVVDTTCSCVHDRGEVFITSSKELRRVRKRLRTVCDRVALELVKVKLIGVPK